MLLRTSSAPVLSSLHSPCFSQPEAGKDSSEFAQFFSSAASSSSHSLAPLLLQPHCSFGDLHGISPAADDPRAATARDLDPGRISRTRGLSRVQSDGDLARFSPAMSTVADENEMVSGFDSAGSHGRRKWARRVSSHSISSFDMKESILEESEREEDTDEQPASCGNSSICHRKQTALPRRREALPDPKPTQGFVLNDGELYTSFEMSPSGSPVACNAKGCRPLKDSECKKLGLLDMASGLGSGFDKGGGVNGWIGQDGRGGPEFSNNTEAYYESLLQADPENPLLLRNYAQFLSEKKGDFKRSEEYYERAILACPNDGEVLSQYAKLQWDVHRDQDRAEIYYDQAVQAAPDDCYVMASYASFLWDAEENEEENPSPSAMPVYGAASHVPSPLLASA